jgi:cysteine desulfurase / selenocysteine lyase
MSLNTDLVANEFAHISSTYFNTAYFGPSPKRSKNYVEKTLHNELDPSFSDYHEWMQIPETTRELIAKLLNTSIDCIAHGTSSSELVAQIAEGIEWKKNDVVVSFSHEYPSNVLTWKRLEEEGRLQFKVLPAEISLDPKALADQLPKETKMVNISHVTFDTGKKIDLIEMGKVLKERGILFLVDATQSLGGLEITPKELESVDILVCSTYKWLLGAHGHAFLYIRPELQDKIRHWSLSWTKAPFSKKVSSLLNYTTETLPGARKFDRGQASNRLINKCLQGSLELLLELGLKNIQAHNANLRDYFLSNYPRSKYQLKTPENAWGNIICLKAKRESEDLASQLKTEKIDISVREGNLRISFHLFNTKSEVEKLLAALNI